MEFRLLFIALLFIGGPSAQAIDVGNPDVKSFIDSMVSEHSYDRETLEGVLLQAETKESILEAIAKPAERRLEWHEYRDIFLTDKRIKAGADFWRGVLASHFLSMYS